MPSCVVPDSADKLLLFDLEGGQPVSPLEHAQSGFAKFALDDVLDISLIATYLTSSHSPLVGTILRDTIPLFPASVATYAGRNPSGTLQEELVLARRGLQLEEALELLVQKYQVLEDASRVNLFFSAGWDSRVELASILRFVAPHRISLFHFDEGAEASKVVNQVAERYGLGLVELGSIEEQTRAVGAMSRGLSAALDQDPIWRPSIPAYFEVLQADSADTAETRWLGYGSWGMKGRYEVSLPRSTADIHGNLWRLRPISPSQRFSSETGQLRSTNHQSRTWARMLSLTSSFPMDVAQDYASWALSDGLAYSGRIRALRERGLTVVSGRFDQVSIFWGLEPSAKLGNTFQRYFLKYLLPEASDIPVLSSSDGPKREDSTHDLRRLTVELLDADLATNEKLEQHRRVLKNSQVMALLQEAKKSSSTIAALGARQIERFILSALSAEQD